MRFVALFIVVTVANFAFANEESRPNVLVILADDLGYSDLGCYGGEIPTPHIDRLAGGGARFEVCYNSARCCPSRASLMTGLYPHQTGIGWFALERPDERRGPAYIGHLNDRCVTIAEVLQRSGYHTAMVGKWHMSQPGPIERGFNEFYGYVRGYAQNQWQPDSYLRLPADREPELAYQPGEFYATDVFTDYALEFLRQARTTDKPWLLYVAHSSPHFPLQAPRASVDKFVDTYRQGWDRLRQQRAARQREIGLWRDGWALSERSLVPVDRDDIANGYSGQPNPAWESLPADRREDLARRMAIFAAMVSHVDEGVGRLVDDLQAHDELDNTLIVFVSDNGACYEWGPFGFDGPSRKGTTTLHAGQQLAAMGGPDSHLSYGSAWANLGNTPLRKYKHFCHEGGIASPLILHWPEGIGAHADWIRDPSHVMDIMPTVCDATGATYPQRFGDREILPVEGTSLLPAVRGELGPRELAFEHQEARAYRSGDWKVVWSKRQTEPIEWELYNLANDRCETNNLATAEPERTQQLAAKWFEWAERVKVYPFFPGANADRIRDRESRNQTPSIANCKLRIACDVQGDASHGVLLAQGGNQRGYALHLDDGHLVFSVRSAGRLVSVRSPEMLPKEFRVEAVLAADASMRLTVNDKLVTTGQAAALIAMEPIDGLSIGEDSESDVADYGDRERFDGQVSNIDITAERVPLTHAAHAVPAPLFADPHYHGSCDPEIVWNAHEREWWVFYTARRAKRKTASYVGTPIGVAASRDFEEWRFVGYCSFDGQQGEPDMPVSFWAPGIVADGDSYHMFVTYKSSAKPPWGGDGMIRHYVAPANDLLAGWRQTAPPDFTQPDPIDATLIEIGERFHAYYRVGKQGGIHWATSDDLLTWRNQGRCGGDVNRRDIHRLGYQEAPYVFRFADAYWMLTDPHQGLAVYRSPAGQEWTYQGQILKAPGRRDQDNTLARHPSVAVVGNRAFLIYHVEPNRPYPSPPPEKRTIKQKLSYLQLAELRVVDNRLVVDRNSEVLPPKRLGASTNDNAMTDP